MKREFSPELNQKGPNVRMTTVFYTDKGGGEVKKKEIFKIWANFFLSHEQQKYDSVTSQLLINVDILIPAAAEKGNHFRTCAKKILTQYIHWRIPIPSS